MPTPAMTKETASARMAVLKEHGGNITHAANALGIGRATMQHTVRWAKGAARKGMFLGDVVMPGFEIASVSNTYGKDGEVKGHSVRQKPESGEQFKLPPKHMLKGGTYQVSGDGRVERYWPRTAPGAIGNGLVEAMREAFAEHEGMAPIVRAPRACAKNQVTIYPIPDVHLGMLSWKEETGESYDLKIAYQTVASNFDKLVTAQAAPSEEAVICFLGDFFHIDDTRNVTPTSHHSLDADGRFQKVLGTGAELALHMIGRLLQVHARVRVIVIRGNHDPHASEALTLGLKMFYSKSDRVKIDPLAKDIAYHHFGVNLIGFAHGHKVTPDRMLAAMTSDMGHVWGEAWCRYFFTGHVHHKNQKEAGSLITESLPPITALDAYAFGGGFRSNRAIEAIRFDRSEGFSLRWSQPIRPSKVAA